MRKYRVYVGTFIADIATTVRAESEREAWFLAVYPSRYWRHVLVDVERCDSEEVWEVRNGAGRRVGTVIAE